MVFNQIWWLTRDGIEKPHPQRTGYKSGSGLFSMVSPNLRQLRGPNIHIAECLLNLNHHLPLWEKPQKGLVTTVIPLSLVPCVGIHGILILIFFYCYRDSRPITNHITWCIGWLHYSVYDINDVRDKLLLRYWMLTPFTLLDAYSLSRVAYSWHIPWHSMSFHTYYYT